MRGTVRGAVQALACKALVDERTYTRNRNDKLGSIGTESCELLQEGEGCPGRRDFDPLACVEEAHSKARSHRVERKADQA